MGSAEMPVLSSLLLGVALAAVLEPMESVSSAKHCLGCLWEWECFQASRMTLH